MNPLELYLARVARELRSMPTWKQEEELRELRSHLEQRVEDFERDGLNRKDAQTRATEAFGSAKALGRNLGDAWEGVPQSWRDILAVVLRVLVIAFAAKFTLSLLSWSLFLGDESLLVQTLRAVSNLLFACISIGCGGLLSLWLGRRGPKVVLSLGVLLWVVDAPFLVAFVVYTKMVLTGLWTIGLLLSASLSEFILWLPGAILFHFVLQRRWRNLPPGQTPNDGRKNFRFGLRFRPRQR